jgi:hypothetical protein
MRKARCRRAAPNGRGGGREANGIPLPLYAQGRRGRGGCVHFEIAWRIEGRQRSTAYITFSRIVRKQNGSPLRKAPKAVAASYDDRRHLQTEAVRFARRANAQQARETEVREHHWAPHEALRMGTIRPASSPTRPLRSGGAVVSDSGKKALRLEQRAGESTRQTPVAVKLERVTCDYGHP